MFSIDSMGNQASRLRWGCGLPFEDSDAESGDGNTGKVGKLNVFLGGPFFGLCAFICLLKSMSILIECIL